VDIKELEERLKLLENKVREIENSRITFQPKVYEPAPLLHAEPSDIIILCFSRCSRNFT
jgi:hypothetical protein